MSDATNALVTGPPRSGETTALESSASVLAVIEADATDDGIEAAKNRPDMVLFVVGPDARDALPETRPRGFGPESNPDSLSAPIPTSNLDLSWSVWRPFRRNVTGVPTVVHGTG